MLFLFYLLIKWVDYVLSKVCVLLDKNNFIQSEVNHALSIILRAYDEIQYMIGVSIDI